MRITTFFKAVLPLTLVGCAMTHGTNFTPKELDQVVLCKTTKSELISIMGKPTSVVASGARGDELIWSYMSVGHFSENINRSFTATIASDLVTDYGFVGTPLDIRIRNECKK
ncbi:hypothetical protein A9Q99_08735 [Gammaproteobacteria bacterium 45_16_T64]|nr:hypothetical protein A9Q99_08735 [Gammaproteobacteria bacterium 45_16_T64]